MVLALAPPGVGRAGVLFGPDSVAADGSVVWRSVEIAASPATLALRSALEIAANGADSAAAWRAATEDSVLAAYALRRLAPDLLAGGDTLAADRAWSRLAEVRSIWTYEALRGRVDLMMLRGAPAAADSLLERADRTGWPELEQISWLVRRAELQALIGDTLRAIDLARQAMRRGPALVPARRALRDFEQWMKATGQPLDTEDEIAAAQVEQMSPDARAATARLTRALNRAEPGARWSAGLELAGVLRARRLRDEALRVIRGARAPDSIGRAAVALERARIHRDAGASEAAFHWYRAAASLAPDAERREIAWWEMMREAEELGRWELVREAAERVAELGGPRAENAALRRGLAAFTARETTSALEWWGRAGGDGGDFWRAIAMRTLGANGADSLLDQVARRPGYRFYRAAARETLGVQGWSGQLARAATVLDPGLELARQLSGLGAEDEALRLCDRWLADDPRLRSDSLAPLAPDADSPVDSEAEANGEEVSVPHPRPRQLLAAARLAFGMNRIGSGVRYARAAFDALADSAAESQWGIAPWMYPPAPASLFGDASAEAAAASAPAPDPGLLYGVIWQESRFDPLARSRSNALGLMQLKRGTAVEQARLMRLPAPSERDLFEPALNVKLGTGYLTRMLQRFGGRVTLALAAYNAGPTTARRWESLGDPGGEAMTCERIGHSEPRAYVRIILGVRQAVREMRPRDGGGRSG